MKKLVCIIISVLLLAASFSGCGSKNDTAKIEELINNAFKLNEKLNDLNLSSVTSMYYDYGTTSYSIENSSELMVHNVSNSEKYEMSETTTQRSSTSANATNYEAYYKDGYYYTTRYGGAFKTKISAKEAGIDNIGSLINIKYSDMRSVGFKTETDDDESKEWGKGYTAITFTCKNSTLQKFIGRTAESDADDYEQVDIKKGEGEYVINADGYLVYEKLTVASVITLDGGEVSSTISSEVTYNDVGKEVDPYNPEDETYVEVDNIEDVIEINSAMSKTLSSNDYVMNMDAEAEIVQDKTKAGYKRTFLRQQDLTGSEFAQKTVTTYLSDGKSGSQLESSQYYTDGRYYQYSDMYSQKIYCVMDFSKFISGIYMNSGVSPASAYSTGMMKNIKSSKTDDGKVYSYALNPDSEDGLTFLSSIVGPYENFAGDFSSADIKVKSFEGKIYTDANGYYCKSEVNCEVLVKFEEGDVTMNFAQTISVNKIDGDVKCEFPDFSKVDYERMEQSDLLGAFSGSTTSSEN